MSNVTREVRSPVKREGADQLVLISLVSFALSVIITRLFLHLTGYPMIANDTLHIAHVLWGGLLLFIASLLPLILANRWALRTSAILSGIGVGLFIDEVGKFITMNNDYHFQPAAPIIYAFFLLTVFVYLRVRRPPMITPRSEMYRIFGEMTEVLDQDLDKNERDNLEQRLIRVENRTDDPYLQQLAHALHQYLTAEVSIVTPRLTHTQRVLRSISRAFFGTVNQSRMRMLIVLALAVLGIAELIQFGILMLAFPNPFSAIFALFAPFVTHRMLTNAQDALWYIIRMVLQGSSGVALIIAGGMIAARRERTGIRVASMTLIIWLSVINLLVFYFDQFGATASTLVQFFVLLAVTYYRGMYIVTPKSIPLEEKSQQSPS
jgi:hypothetical protein